VEIIGSQRILTFSEGSDDVSALSCSAIRKNGAYRVQSFMDLATKVAELQFRNRDFVLMFRGQRGDYRNRLGYTSLRSSLMRAATSTKVPKDSNIQRRFEKLVEAEQALVTEYRKQALLGQERLDRQRILRWAILQHYEICETPLLDVTQSLRIAASFASDKAEREAYVFVLGIPHISGAITASAEAGLQVVRLASVCPPTAVRPHIQEGYLLGEYPDFSSAEQKLLYSHAEMDFARRLIAKFRFEPDSFWDKSGNFPQVGEKALYPRDTQDPMCALAETVKSAIARS
jgi:FRG domain